MAPAKIGSYYCLQLRGLDGNIWGCVNRLDSNVFLRSKKMAVEATGSKFSRNNNLIMAVVCLAFASWFGYDGWVGEYHDEELVKNNGKPTPNLYFNQYAPVPLAVVAIFALVAAAKVPSRRITADDKGLTLSDGREIPYSSIKKIDKREFDKGGHFIIEYSENETAQQLKLSDRKYDNLGLLLDEIVRQTGAAPDESVQDKS